MKKFKKEKGKYIIYLKLPLLIIFILSVIQSIFLMIGISFFNLTNSTNPIGILKLIVVLCTGFYLVSKKKFKLINNLFAGTLLFAASLLTFFFVPSIFPRTIPLIFRLINYGVIILVNLVLFVLTSVVGGIIAKLYLILKKKHNEKHR